MKKLIIAATLLISTGAAMAGTCTMVGELQDDGNYVRGDGRAMEYKRSGDTIIVGGRTTYKKTGMDADGSTIYINEAGTVASKMGEPVEHNGKTVRKYFTSPSNVATQGKWLRAFVCKDGFFD